MSFNMEIELSKLREWIHEDEEYFLHAAEHPGIRCPQLQRVFRDFYKDPKIFPNHADAIVKELDLLAELAAAKKPEFAFPMEWKATHARLRHFFQEAHRLDSMIYCRSD